MKIKVAVEGPLGCGKSTILNRIKPILQEMYPGAHIDQGGEFNGTPMEHILEVTFEERGPAFPTCIEQVKEEELVCSFCSKTREEVRWLIAGPEVYICDECISLCGDIVDELEEEWTKEHPTVDAVITEVKVEKKEEGK
jgi:hypothetical protein